jgi:hypothetical protein
VFGTENTAQVRVPGYWLECRSALSGGNTEAADVLGDEQPVKIVCGGRCVLDALVPELGHQPALERAIDAFAPASGLRAVGENESDSKCSHRHFEMRGFVVALEAVDAAVASGGKLAGPVEIEGLGQAVAARYVVDTSKQADSVSWAAKRPQRGFPVASSVASTRTSGGRLSPSQRWGLPSRKRSSPN